VTPGARGAVTRPHQLSLHWLALAAALVTFLSVGCGAGQEAQTAGQITGTGGAYGQTGEISVLDAQFVFDGPIAGDEVYRPGADAPLQLTIVNAGAADDRLVEVSSPVAASVRITGDPRIPGGQALTAGYVEPVASVEARDARPIEITLVGLIEPVRAGLTYPVTFTFEDAGSLTLALPVENPDVLPPRAEPGR
jgi:copper(I)-binding protein